MNLSKSIQIWCLINLQHAYAIISGRLVYQCWCLAIDISRTLFKPAWLKAPY